MRPLLPLLNALSALTLTLALPLTPAAHAATEAPAPAQAPLQLSVYNAPATSFHVNATLVTGAQDAVLIDAGFSRADALRIAARVLDSGKRLTTIVVSQADPDYWFGVETLHALFPQAQVLSPAPVVEKIRGKMAGKLAYWGPKMGSNAPQSPVLPQALVGDRLMLDGQAIEFRGTTGPLAHRPWVWIPSARAVVGNIAVFGGMHVWTADTQSAAERAAWVAQLDEMAALQPARVVPGHMAAGTPTDASTLAFTKGWLQSFEQQLGTAKTSGALVSAMQKAWPQVSEGALNLELGAKVNLHEMAW